MKKCMVSKKKGFTLVEVIVVISIICILATFIVPKLGSYVKTAKNTKIQSDAKVVLNAVEMYNSTDEGETTPITTLDTTSIGKLHDVLPTIPSNLNGKTVSEIESIANGAATNSTQQ